MHGHLIHRRPRLARLASSMLIPVGLASLAATSLALASAFSLLSPSASTALPAADEPTVPGDVEAAATYTCIGIKWWIGGDSDLDCRVTTEFRRSGDAAWRPGQPLLRVEPGTQNQYEVDPGNLLAGSLFDLRAGTTYEVRLTLADPDGGSDTRTLTVETRPEWEDPLGRSVRFVVPGDGGGSGSSSDPFRGVLAADAAASPGDIFMLAPGVYDVPARLTASGTADAPIVWRGEDANAVVFDGGGGIRTVLDVSGTRHVHLEKLTIRDPAEAGIRALDTDGLIVRGCVIDVGVQTDYDQVAINLRGPASRNATVSGNVIRGPVDWSDGRHADDYGLIATGTGHVIRHNEILDWWDGIQIGADDPDVETSNCDVHGNEIYNLTDDGIETDSSRHNVRVFDNRITNVLCGVSCQPVYGGPVYIIRNAVYNCQLKPLKFHVWPTGMIVLHNTLVCADPKGWGGGQWRNAILRNNIIIGGSDAGHGQSGSPMAFSQTGVRADLDYNGWYQASPDRFASFNGVTYASLDDFREDTGFETHGLLLDLGALAGAEEPPLGSYLGATGYFTPYQPGDQDLSLDGSSIAIDAGEILANVNDGFTGTAPDLGAYELGAPIPTYGPMNDGETTPVQLVFFRAERAGRSAIVRWRVGSETDHAGFELYREADGSPRVRLTDALLHGRRDYAFTDSNPPAIPARYWLREISLSGEATWLGPAAIGELDGSPALMATIEARPNPFSSLTTFGLDLDSGARVRLRIFDAQGRLVATLLDERLGAGRHLTSWDARRNDGSSVSPGIYVARLEVNGEVTTMKLARVR